jgi:hypothetical protein
MLALQGFPMCCTTLAVERSQLSHNHLCQLAGNAYNGFALLAVATSLVTIVIQHMPPCFFDDAVFDDAEGLPTGVVPSTPVVPPPALQGVTPMMSARAQRVLLRSDSDEEL